MNKKKLAEIGGALVMSGLRGSVYVEIHNTGEKHAVITVEVNTAKLEELIDNVTAQHSGLKWGLLKEDATDVCIEGILDCINETIRSRLDLS